MRRTAAAIVSVSLLSIIILSTAFIAILDTPSRGQPETQILVVASTTSETTNSTELIVHLSYPNRTRFTTGEMFAGSIQSRQMSDQFVFNSISPGTYLLNISSAKGVYLPTVSAKVSEGINVLNLTVYQLKTLTIVETANLALNGSQPGPEINVENGTAVRFVIHNNTTLIHNLAVVSSLYNTSFASVLFDSLSNTVSAGGSVNDTFIATQVGSFHYECLIGNHARDGEYGNFTVTPS